MTVIILVTGGTGFIGCDLIETLIARGETVRALVRQTSNTKHLEEINVEFAVVDLRNPESIDQAMQDVDIIFHLAAAPDWSTKKEHWNTNYLATKNMLEAALKWKVKRFVHCSTIGLLGFADESPLNEYSPYSPPHYSPYCLTKCEAEKKVRAYYKKGLPIVIIRPAQVYGPRGMGTMGFAFKLIQRGFTVLFKGGKALLQPVYVQDVVDSLILAMEPDEVLGQVYNIAGERILTFKEWFSTIADAFEVNTHRINCPRNVAWILGYLMETKIRIFGGKALITRYRIECATRNMTYDISKAKEELGFIPKVGLEEGVKRTVQWCRNNASSNIE